MAVNSVRRARREEPTRPLRPSPDAVECVERLEIVGRPLGRRLAERWADLREAWSQTTFYLFDPESWR